MHVYDGNQIQNLLYRSFFCHMFILAINTDSLEVRLDWAVSPGDTVLSTDQSFQPAGDSDHRINGQSVNIQSDSPISYSGSLVRHVEPGVQLQLECTIEERLQMEQSQTGHSLRVSDTTSVFLLCPLSTGVCLEDCKPTPNVHNITCEEFEPESDRTSFDHNLTTRTSRRIRYRIPQVTGRHNGTWLCQNKGVSSERHELQVSGKTGKNTLMK